MILAKGIDTTFNSPPIVELKENNNMIILGNLTFDNGYKIFTTDSSTTTTNNNIIIGQNSFVLFNAFPIITQSTSDVYYIYPGCTIKDNIHTSYQYNALLLNSNGIIYLNRYMNNTASNLKGTLNFSMKIIYANDSINLQSDANNQYTYPDCFPKLYWHGQIETHKKATSLSTMSDGGYFFQEPESPLEFIEDPNNGNKEVLSIKDDIAARCDVSFWDQCYPDNWKYGIQAYNKINNRGKYINVDTLENLFYNGKNYNTTGLLQNMPNEIFVGLIGNKNIVIENNSENKEIVLLGDNSGYTGIMEIPENITDIYLKTISKIGQIKYKNVEYTIKESMEIYSGDTKIEPETLDLKFHYIDLATIVQEPEKPIADTKSNVIIDNLTGSENKVIETDSTELILLGNNSEYIGTITIPDSINDVYLKKSSIIQSGIIYKEKIYKITIDEKDNITYKVDNTPTEPENLGLKFHFIDIDLLPQLKDLEDKLTQAQSDLEIANKTKEEINTQLTSTKEDKRLVEEELERIRKELANAKQISTSNNSNQSKETKVKPSKSVSTQTGDGSIKHSKNEYKYEHVWKLCENGDTVRYKLDHHHNSQYSDISD